MVDNADSDNVDYDDGGHGLCITMIMMLLMILKAMFFCERYRGLGETERKRLEHDEDRSNEIFEIFEIFDEDRWKAEIFESTLTYQNLSLPLLVFHLSPNIFLFHNRTTLKLFAGFSQPCCSTWWLSW